MELSSSKKKKAKKKSQMTWVYRAASACLFIVGLVYPCTGTIFIGRIASSSTR
jgi:hypothetical protein